MEADDLKSKRTKVFSRRSFRFLKRRLECRASWQFSSLVVRRRAWRVLRIQRIACFRGIWLPSSWPFFDQYRLVSRIIVNHPGVGNRLINPFEVFPAPSKSANGVRFRNAMPTLLNTQCNSAEGDSSRGQGEINDLDAIACGPQEFQARNIAQSAERTLKSKGSLQMGDWKPNVS